MTRELRIFYGLTPQVAGYLTIRKRQFERALARFADTWPAHRALLNYALSSGHRNRPLACLLACEAVGGSARTAEPAALAIELCHKASVIRDDLEDGDSYRSGKPAFHTKFGVPIAVAFSDMLMSSALTVITTMHLENNAAVIRCTELFIEAYRDMACGQLLDIYKDPKQDRRTSSMQVDALKTGTLGSLAFHLGGIIGGGKPDQVDALARFGAEISEAFQILNDVNNLVGEEAAGGRTPGTDIKNKRHTILVEYSRQHATPALRSRIDGLLGTDINASASEVEQMRRALIDLGADRFGETLAAFLLRRSQRYLEVLPKSHAKSFFATLANENTFRKIVF